MLARRGGDWVAHAFQFPRGRFRELRAEGLTLRDIATRCRVSKTTVIRALKYQLPRYF
jgi:hypothetical protein